jgi:cytoskeletal protein CcmA (bactofilin family)
MVATLPLLEVSIIGVEMTLEGDCRTPGTIMIGGTVRGDVYAEKALVGGHGLVYGRIHAEDAVIAGRAIDSVHVASCRGSGVHRR